MPMHYGKSLYQTNKDYTVHHFKTRDDWLAGRSDLHGIGGSDASAALSLNPWRSNLDLWQIKTGRKQAPDISDSERVQYGQNAEEYIRRLFQLKFKDVYEIQYQDNTILQNNDHPEFLYSPDGLILEKGTGRRGIFECKTTTLMKSYDKEKWHNQVPQNYYIQVIHGLNTTGFEFVDLFAEITYDEDYSQLRRYHIERDDISSDVAAEFDGVHSFWFDYIVPDKEPPLIIQGL